MGVCKIQEDNFDDFQKALKKGQIQACLIMQNESIVFKYYKNKKSENMQHPIHSCSKSIVSILMGIVIKDGTILDIDTPIMQYLKSYANDFKNGKEHITIRHLLTMTSGIDWPEFGEWNFGSPMEYSKDIIKFILERQQSEAIGTKMNYNSGCSNLLSYILQTVSGMKLSEYANQHLFAPLGISDYTWHEKQGISLGANGLRMKVDDMMKLGYLYLHNGKINDTVIVPENWIEESTKPYFITYDDIGYYGLHWWVSSLKTKENIEAPYYFALGLFGQYIIVVPKYEMIVVFVSENYGDTMKPMKYFRQHFAEIIG